MIETTKGLIERDRLTVKDKTEEGEDYRATATEWFLDGELVRRDVWVVKLRGLEMTGAQQGVG